MAKVGHTGTEDPISPDPGVGYLITMGTVMGGGAGGRGGGALRDLQIIPRCLTFLMGLALRRHLTIA